MFNAETPVNELCDADLNDVDRSADNSDEAVDPGDGSVVNVSNRVSANSACDAAKKLMCHESSTSDVHSELDDERFLI